MKKLILAILLTAVSTSAMATSSKITFSCIGWMPIYDKNGVLINPSSGHDNSNLVITIDKLASTFSARLPVTGDIVASLIIKDEYYSGTAPLSFNIGQIRMISTDFSINRYTGKTLVLHTSDRGDGSGLMGFVGDCSVAEQKF